MSKTVTIKLTEDVSKEFEKAFYKKATVHKIGDTYYLQSYSTIVASYDGSIHKHWSDWSATTSRHVDAFCRLFNTDAISKKDWLNMKWEKPKEKPYKELNYKVSPCYLGF